MKNVITRALAAKKQRLHNFMRATMIALCVSMTTASAWAVAYTDRCPFEVAQYSVSGVTRDYINSRCAGPDSMSYNDLDGGSWKNNSAGISIHRGEKGSDGSSRIGSSFSVGSSNNNSKQSVFSIFECKQEVPSYSRIRLKWSFQLGGWMIDHCQTMALYARDNLSQLKSTKVYNRTWWTEGSNYAGKQYYIGHMSDCDNGNLHFGATKTKEFDFDNRNSSSKAEKSWYVMVTHVVESGNSHKNVNQGALVNHVNAVWDTAYYKHITYNANGGTGNLEMSTIENSGALRSNYNKGNLSISRTGYVFEGWNTLPDGITNNTGTAFVDKASITANATDKGKITLYAQWLPIPKIIDCKFSQRDHSVQIKWLAYKGNSVKNARYTIYRNGTYVGYVNHNFSKDTVTFTHQNTGISSDFPYESNVTYEVYLVLNPWAISTKRTDLKSSVSINTERTIPIKNFRDKSESDRIVLTWQSDGYPVNQEHKFVVYVDNVAAYTINPAAEQTSFRWEHRHADNVTNGTDGNTYYTTGQLSATNPHVYTVKSFIGNKQFSTVVTGRIAIGSATEFYSFDASKGVYSGAVKLSWHVDRKGSTKTQIYTLERRSAQNEQENWLKIYEVGSDQEYFSYTDDNPHAGTYYEYRITVKDPIEDGATTVYLEKSTTDIGFTKAVGTITGRITYGASGVAVADVEIVAEQVDSTNTQAQYNAVKFTATNGTLTWDYPSATYAAETFSASPLSIQFWIEPERNEDAQLVRLNGNKCYIGIDAHGHPTWVNGSETYTFNQLTLATDKYSHLAFTRSGNNLTVYQISFDANTNQMVTSKQQQTLSGNLDLSGATQFIIGGYVGYVDEFRIWKKALSEKEIKNNFDHLLGGDEANLEAYWPFDEGLSNIFIDYSRVQTDYNSHHGKVGNNIQFSSNHTPAQLRLKTNTDQYGNYVLRDVPFAGNGTTYAIIPTFGIHSFNPSQQLRYLSLNSQVHNATDFEDVSSFPVNGTVCYAGTSYPVEGCNLYVDGEMCAKDGEPIITGSDGKYEISVPIGEHFIQVKKEGHVFAHNGRYPEDPNSTGTRIEFKEAVNNLDFKDETLVNLTGRVVGGNVEGDKPIGFGLSKNNIGKATLTLVPQNNAYRLNVQEVVSGTIINVQPNNVTVPVASARPDTIHSTAWRGTGEDNSRKIFICTDPATGEFSAMVPPIAYVVENIKVDWSGMNIINTPLLIDMSDPQTVYKDSLTHETGEMEYYPFHTLLRQIYHPENATFMVRQTGSSDGAFGIDRYVFEDEYGVMEVNEIHYINSNTGKLEYSFGYPLFKTLDPYQFEIEGYELFVNKDNGDSVSYKVPLVNTMVTIENALSADQTVYTINNEDGAEPGSIYQLQSNQLRLDSAGKATYIWYGGYPNISGDHTRTLNIYYGENRKSWEGNPLTGIILGSFPTGNNFVTLGPDQVDMILRDPPGSQSFATWETGMIATERIYKSNFVSTNYNELTCQHCKKNWNLDFAMTGGASVGNGTAAGSIGMNIVTGVFKKYQTKENYTQTTNSYTMTTSSTVTKAISTSANPEYDGPDADLFIGTGSNYIIGNTRKVGLYRNPQDMTKAIVDMNEAMSYGINFGTDFVYSRHHIVHTLLPEIRKKRNELLTVVPDTSSAINPSATNIIYATQKQKTDPDFGEYGTYKVLLPADTTGKVAIDSVSVYNAYISDWTYYLALEESEKVNAFAKRDSLQKANKLINYSYDAGATIAVSKTVINDNSVVRDTIKSETMHYHKEKNYSIFGVLGRQSELYDSDDANGSTHRTELDTLQTATFSYTLKDNDANDALTVDVYQYGPYGPVFRTRGGQTSNPYEAEVKTQYYQPGTIIMESTAQVDVPKLEVEPRTRSNVPSGSAATYELRLQNWSETGAERPYKLMMADHTNIHGAQLLIDGMPLTDGRIFRVPGGQEIKKTLQLKQSNVSTLDYDSIGIVLASVGQSDPMSGMPIIADTVYINAYFVPSSSPVAMALSTTTLNTQTGTDLTISMKDFDRYYKGLKAFRLQYKPQGGTWTQFYEYVLKDSDLSGSQSELLPSNIASEQYTLPMASFTDGEYTFRIVSVSTYGAEEIKVYSNEVNLTKDMYKPRALGLPEPADGILDIGDELSITFNEPILSGELTSTKNFLVTGVLNGDAVDHAVALQANAGITEPAAQTEAAINLSGRDFSLDVWLNIHSAGALLTHGTGKQKMIVSTNETGQLVVSLAGSVYTSQETLPRDKWIFVTLSRKIIGDSAKMSFAVAYDDVTQPLFIDKPVPLYYGNGSISVGCGAAAAVHELLLWDEARDVTTALAQRSVTKSPATRHLIGYWKMNEGEGTVIRDYARNRHMAMTDETWYLNNVNKAVKLSAGQQLKVNTAAVFILPDDDYALELWFKTSQTTETQLLQVGKDTLLLRADGQLTLKSDSHVLPVNNKFAVNDGVWHHIALNVLRMGTAALYIDGNRALTVPASNMAAFGSAFLTIGGNFTGMVDEIRLWGATMNANQLARNRKVRLNGNEPGLELYYPFEEKTLDEYNQVVVRGTGKEMTGKGQDAVISGQPSAISYTDDVPALREKMTETNVPFSFTASDTKIVLSLDADPAKLEGCTLNFTVRNVRDRNGNNSVEALWSAFVHRGQLMWEKDEIRVEQEMQKGSSFTATLINRSGSAVTWTLGTLPAWLSASVETGTLSPLAQTHITFDVNETTPIGKYEQTIYAIGSNGIEMPLTLYLTVTGDVPEWSVDQSKYPYTMTVIGRLEIFNVSSDDPDDIIAAFIGDECRGVAHPEYKARYDSYFLTLQIYGDKDDKDKEIMFRVYDASTGITYSQVSSDTSIPYNNLSFIGKYDDPVLFSVEDKVEQHTILRKGWNWLSINVAAENMSPKAILSKVADDVLTIKAQGIREGLLQHDSTGWSGKMETLQNNRMYMVQMKNERDLRLVGRRVSANQTPVSLQKKWNWIGYYELQRLSVADALANMDPQSGDVIRSQRAFSYFDAYEWVGSLSYMEPGVGYIVYNTADKKEFAYPSAAIMAAPYIRNHQTAVNEPDTTDFTPVEETAYPFNMILVARVTNNDLVMANTELGVFAGDECRAVGTTDDEGIVYLLIPGEESAPLTFKIVVDDKVLVSKQSFDYETDAVVGNHSNPYEVLFGSGQGFESIDEAGEHSVQKVFYNGHLYIIRNGEIYNAQGARVE